MTLPYLLTLFCFYYESSLLKVCTYIMFILCISITCFRLELSKYPGLVFLFFSVLKRRESCAGRAEVSVTSRPKDQDLIQ